MHWCDVPCLQMYEQQRGNLHESSYNIGRAAHQLGLLHIAQHYYEKALAAAPDQSGFGMGVDGMGPTAAATVGSGLQGTPSSQSLNLTREIAHNLALIYRASGAPLLAKQLYRQYLTVL
jgi:general transcription factor 3C polypeptide 3 (transcription factor C subunit 4)